MTRTRSWMIAFIAPQTSTLPRPCPSQSPDRVGDLTEGIGAPDDRRDLAGLDELLQDEQVPRFCFAMKVPSLWLTKGDRMDAGSGVRLRTPSAPFASTDHQRPPGGEGSPEVWQ